MSLLLTGAVSVCAQGSQPNVASKSEVAALPQQTATADGHSSADAAGQASSS